MKWSNIKELLMHILFFLTACVSIFAVVLICVFLFANGIPAIGKIGVFKFLLGTKWKPGNDIYGILPMILGSLYVTAGAIIIGVPIGLLTAVFLAKFCPKGLYKILKPATELMAGVPSVVYGFFGLVVLVPLVQNIFGVAGNTMLTASVLLGIMILPTIIGVSESAIRAVPGILSGVILAIGRVVGESAALMYTAGSVAQMPGQAGGGLFDSVRTLSVHMYVLSSEGLHIDKTYATAVVLLVIVIGINALSSFVAKKITKKQG